jgi:hypothetical protein
MDPKEVHLGSNAADHERRPGVRLLLLWIDVRIGHGARFRWYVDSNEVWKYG